MKRCLYLAMIMGLLAGLLPVLLTASPALAGAPGAPWSVGVDDRTVYEGSTGQVTDVVVNTSLVNPTFKPAAGGIASNMNLTIVTVPTPTITPPSIASISPNVAEQGKTLELSIIGLAEGLQGGVSGAAGYTVDIGTPSDPTLLPNFYKLTLVYDPAQVFVGAGADGTPIALGLWSATGSAGVDPLTGYGYYTLSGACAKGATGDVAFLPIRLIVSATAKTYIQVYWDQITAVDANHGVSPIACPSPGALMLQRGDINGDGEVDINDAMVGTLYLANMAAISAVNVINFASIDTDMVPKGNLITARDVELLLMYLAGKADSFFTPTVGAASKLAFTTSPAGAVAGLAFITQPVVAIEDSLGNVVTSDSSTSVTVAIKTGTGTSEATLSDTKTVTASGGYATFTDLSIDKSGTGYKLTATSSPALTSADSSSFNVAAGTATQIGVETAADGTGTIVPAQNVTAGSSVTGYAITRDAYGNFVANVAGTWSLVRKTGGVSNGDLVASGNHKSATFTGHRVGTAKIHVAKHGLISHDSGTLTVVRGAAN